MVQFYSNETILGKECYCFQCFMILISQNGQKKKKIAKRRTVIIICWKYLNYFEYERGLMSAGDSQQQKYEKCAIIVVYGKSTWMLIWINFSSFLSFDSVGYQRWFLLSVIFFVSIWILILSKSTLPGILFNTDFTLSDYQRVIHLNFTRWCALRSQLHSYAKFDLRHRFAVKVESEKKKYFRDLPFFALWIFHNNSKISILHLISVQQFLRNTDKDRQEPIQDDCISQVE